MAFSPGSRFLATGGRTSDDPTLGVVRLWNTTTGEPVGQPFLSGTSHSLCPVVFSPDGRLLAAGGHCTARVWDVGTGQPVGQPLAHPGDVWTVAFSPDSQLLATGGADSPVRLWTTAKAPRRRPRTRRRADDTGRLRNPTVLKPAGAPLVDDTSGVYEVVFSPDGRLLARRGTNRTVQLWAVAAPEPVGPPLKFDGDPTSMAFSPDGRFLAVSSVVKGRSPLVRVVAIG
jgi:WD40 repeat protein